MTATALALGGSVAQAQQVGTASAVNPAATANMKTINIGQSIAHRERIQTKANGSVQLLFLDKTSMTIGPNSDLTIDEYVYDPNANTGKLAATLSKGALRFVGGQISHNGDAEIKTASAVIGIRGGVMMTDGRGGIYAGYGTSTVTSSNQTVTLHAGEFTQTHFGDAPTMPGLPPPGFVLRQIAIFQSAVGQTGGFRGGGASQRIVTAAAQRATGSPTGSVTGAAPPAPVVVTLVGQVNPTTSNVTNAAQTSSQATGTQQLASAIETARQNQQTSSQNPVPTDTTTPTNTTTPPANPTPPVDTTTSTTRPTVTLSGFVSGFDIIAGQNSVPVRPVSGTMQINLDAANNRLGVSATGAPYDSGTSFSPTAGTNSATLQYGATGASGPANSTYTDYDNFSAVVPAGATSNGTPYSGDFTVFNAATTKQIGTSLGMPNLTVCQCDYTRWGFWTAYSTSPTGTTNPTTTEAAFGTWVAGRPAQVSDVPTSGIASYVGHVITTVYSPQNPTSQFFAAGNFTNSVNFGTRTGAVTVTSLDSTNYSGNVAFQN
ncbi:MAG: FecR domain-containing protein, partial [Proteobacteria bacterium]|nr:FecR domain-containing protein [Pseudomonadota bacterium]